MIDYDAELSAEADNDVRAAYAVAIRRQAGVVLVLSGVVAVVFFLMRVL